MLVKLIQSSATSVLPELLKENGMKEPITNGSMVMNQCLILDKELF